MNKILIFFFLISLNSFGQKKNIPKSAYPDYVGDIKFNPETDKLNFELCNKNRIYQYFNNLLGLEYDGEKLAIEKEFYRKYRFENHQNETGFIRINFVVNCKGETDRFRLISMDENYNEKIFIQSITDQLMNITKNLKGWKVKKYQDAAIDYYQYLIFKIEKGQLKEILP